MYLSSPYAVMTMITESSLYADFFERYLSKEMKSKRGEDTPDEIRDALHSRHELLLNITQSCSSFRDMELKIASSSKAPQEESELNGIRLMTVHSSKGLEFESVYIIDLCEERFPNLKMAREGGGGVEEERRLFYVAVTRAKSFLTLSYFDIDDTKKKPKPLKPSRFLFESGLLQKSSHEEEESDRHETQ